MKEIEALQSLAKLYSSDRDKFESFNYNEADTRNEFIDKFLNYMGWDVHNFQNLAYHKREVILEQTNTESMRPDYSLRVDGVTQIYVEAKKPSVDILTDKKSIFQARRYGYTDEHSIVVITNYKNLSIYNASVPVNEEKDHAETALIASWRFDEYEANYYNIKKYIGKEEILTEDWKELVKYSNPENLVPAGEAFLKHLLEWRKTLGENIVKHFPDISQEDLNDVVQLLINRFLFIRMCEDRGIESKYLLQETISSASGNLGFLFNKMDRRYNTGLFESRNDEQKIIDSLDFSVVNDLVSRLYAPSSPFSYAVLSADFLGRVYEQSLTEYLSIGAINSDGIREVRLATKKDYIKRDVVTTPQSLVDFIVSNSVRQIDPNIEFPKVWDFAVGSGRFLLAVLRELIGREIQKSINNNAYENLNFLGKNNYSLKFDRKVEIAEKCLYGVDIDYNAIESTRFALIISLLEGETQNSLPRKNKILPNLNSNLVHGNSIMTPSSHDLSTISFPSYALDLDENNLKDFDLVVGNPPYMGTEEMRHLTGAEFKNAKVEFVTPFKQWDKYFVFIERAINQLVDGGIFGFVVPNKWITNASGAKLRKFIINNSHLNLMANFTHYPVFEDKSIYVCGLIGKKGVSEQKTFEYFEPKDIEFSYLSSHLRTQLLIDEWIPRDKPEEPWVLPDSKEQAETIRAIRRRSLPLGDLLDVRNGLQTSANDVFIISSWRKVGDKVQFKAKIRGEENAKDYLIEDSLLVPYLDDSRRVSSYYELEPDALILFPYEMLDGRMQIVPEEKMEHVYPLTYKYLLDAKARLLKRDKGAQKQMEYSKAFYAFGRGQAFGYATMKPKIIYSTNQKGDKYCIDLKGCAYQSGGTAGEVALYPKNNGVNLDFVLGLLDQPEIEMYIRKRGSSFRGGYYSRGADVISSVPVPDVDFDNVEELNFYNSVVDMVKQLRIEYKNRDEASRREESKYDARIMQIKKRMSAAFHVWWNLDK